jgi:hypothetical protein
MAIADQEKRSKKVADCEKCPRWKQVRNKIRIAKAVQKAITTMDAKFQAADYKPSVAEYLKLLQLEQEFEQDEVKEIKVTWVEPTAILESEK